MRIIKEDHRTVCNALTVEELRGALEDMRPDALVLFVCDYGDHCHTMQALPVAEVEDVAGEEVLVESGYSKSGAAISELNLADYPEDDTEAQEVYMDTRPNIVLLRMGAANR